MTKATDMMESCPYLPHCGGVHGAVAMRVFRNRGQGADYYMMALRCAQALWKRQLPAQSVLLLNRALGADFSEFVKVDALPWPMPYRAVCWIFQNAPARWYLGNPRRHYQHYATRMDLRSREERIARAWACWAIACAVRPEWPADRVQIAEEGQVEPTLDAIDGMLRLHGLPGEAELWREVLGEIAF